MDEVILDIIEFYKNEAERLYQVLDDIDTLMDVYREKDGIPHDAIRKYVEKRHAVIQTDGYNVVWPDHHEMPWLIRHGIGE